MPFPATESRGFYPHLESPGGALHAADVHIVTLDQLNLNEGPTVSHN